MFNFKKNIILTSVNKNNSNVKGVFTIEKNNNSCFGILRIYNLTNLNDNYCLGVLVNGVPLQKTPLNSKVVFCKIELPNSIELNSKVSVVVVESVNGEFNPVVFGSTTNEKFNNCHNFFPTENINKQIEKEIKDQLPELEEVKNPIHQSEISLKALNTLSIKQTEEKPQCENCIYRKTFYTEQEKHCLKESENNTYDENCSEILTSEINEKEQNNSLKSFYEIVAPKLEEIFEINPPCEELNNLVPSSRWATIVVSESEKYYVGIIYENMQVKFIAYAVDGIYSPTPPSRLEQNAQWLPSNSLFPEKNGYWLMFQNAETGE